MGQPPRAEPARPLTVSEVNQRARGLLEEHCAAVVVRGEVSRPTRAASGHVYFTLKDARARIDAVVWAATARGLRCDLTEGLVVRVRGQLTIYPAQGRYQIVCAAVEPEGEGALRAAFLRLKEKLDAEGLTAPERKRPLPFLPRAVGVVTSPTGAAIHDVVTVIRRRFPDMPIVHCAVRVQGDGASTEVAAGIRCLNRRDDVDVLVVGRGGGSLEDLWTFNDEVLARTIAASRLPVVSAVGHEIDVTIADLVADRRALTPTEAGELVVPERLVLEEELRVLRARLDAGLRRVFRDVRSQVARLGERAGMRVFPRRLQDERQGIDALESRLRRAMIGVVAERRARLQALERLLRARSPLAWTRERRREVFALRGRLDGSASSRLDRARTGVEAAGHALRALNPVAVLARGFSVTRLRDQDGTLRIARDGDALAPGTRLLTTLARGAELRSTVDGSGARTLPSPVEDAGAVPEQPG